MLAGLAGRLLHLEGGLLHTAIRLSVAPGHTAREYVAGRIASYTHPAGYLLISFAVFTLLMTQLGGGTGGDNRVFTILAIPCVALASRFIFWRAALNYAEHLILTMYVFGHVALILGAMFVAIHATGGRAGGPLAIAALGLSVLYIGWSYAVFFYRRPVLGALGGIVALAAGSTFWLLALFGLLTVLRSFGAQQ